ncbi:nucleotidyltransferase domain-containing protein [Paraflavitalea soli]|uniref:Nucleotidyltransferase domain-containing protein n=1 Tax=Paraflavitalea soli TaxID=2315862 RepID=A0A3B7MW84_9BACT|nr:nucleotidyltransferase domain-containing protein [Paraflavitalea soli]AXY78754.1 nucleotidyltransferase domain-containing protein [Paraflavitalea soli]
MQATIINKLQAIENDHNIKLLFACESGSRGWQFPSPDSDYDVRFIYVRPYNYYLSVQNRKYDCNFPINDELDIYGWDIRKVLQLIGKSNTTPFEWLQSPIMYKQQPGFRDQLWALCQHFFSRRSNIHHYLGIANGALESMGPGNEIGIKKLFYVLRPMLAAKWCLEKNTIAPMTIGPLMELLPSDLQKEVSDLILLKAGSGESFVIRISDRLRSYITQQMFGIDLHSKEMEKDHFKAGRLDDFFIKTIEENDY